MELWRLHTNKRRCNNESVDLEDATCYLPLWTKPFDPKTELGKEFTVAVRYTIAQQEIWTGEGNTGCDFDDLNGSFADESERAAAYEACRPSTGKVELFFDAQIVEGNTQTGLPWINGHSVFEGVSTQFNLCPSYPKLWVSAVQYKYLTWKKLWEEGDRSRPLAPRATSQRRPWHALSVQFVRAQFRTLSRCRRWLHRRGYSQRP